MSSPPPHKERTFNDARIIKEDPSHAAPRAAGLEVFFPRQGEGAFARMPLEVEVSLYEERFQDADGFGFALRFRQVIVALTCERCDIARDGRYERVLPRDEIVDSIKRTIQTTGSGAASADAKASFSLPALLNGLMGASAGVEGKIAGSTEATESRLQERVRDYWIVSYAPEHRWRVGIDGLGDPTKDGLFLDGRYFNKPPAGASDADACVPLCYAEPDGDAPYAIVIELRARKADCAYIPLGQRKEDDLWKEQNRKKIEELLALRMLEDQNREDGFTPPDGEVILARGRLMVERCDADDQTGH